MRILISHQQFAYSLPSFRGYYWRLIPVMEKKTKILRCLAVFMLLLDSFVLSGCLPVIAVRELTYRPSPSDPYKIWRAYITDSGLLFLCGNVDNGREGMERVERVYNLELRLEETLASQRSDAIQVIKIDDHSPLQMTKGYLSDLCQFDEKRVTERPKETGWTEIFMDPWDQGFDKINHSDIEGGRLPIPPETPRVVLYRVYDSDPPEYLLMGRLRQESPERSVLLVLGSEHIEVMW
jgi:hypothetical protein